jgi:L-alanine-DL-glutamate epimerase-like enolase superfamily enzyme
MKVSGISIVLLNEEIESRRPVPGTAATLQVDGGVNCTIACQIRTDDGLAGWGYGWAYGARRGRLIATAVKEVASLAIGADPLHIEEIWGRFWAFSNFLGHSGLSITGMSVLDMALWDIKAKFCNLPLWLLLGGHKERAPAYSSHLSRFYGQADVDQAEIVAAARGLIDRGHTMLKVWVTTPADLEAVRDLVDRFDSRIRWAVDVVQMWDAPTTLRAADRYRDLPLEWIEDPVPYDDWPGLAEVSRRSPIPICTGENSYYLHEADRLLRETRIRYLSLDLMRCGGISGWQKIAALAQSRHVDVVSHTYPQVAVHLICATPNGALVEDYPVYDGIVGDAIEVVDGSVVAPTEPGIGLTMDEDRLSRGLREEVV